VKTIFWISDLGMDSDGDMGTLPIRNDNFQSDIFSSNIGITDVDVGCGILPTLRSASMPTYGLCMLKLPNLKDSNRLPGVFIAEESITNTNNSSNTRKNSKSFLGMPIWTWRSCLTKKTGHEKSRDTVPLNRVVLE
jgi:hypothetical protein